MSLLIDEDFQKWLLHSYLHRQTRTFLTPPRVSQQTQGFCRHPSPTYIRLLFDKLHRKLQSYFSNILDKCLLHKHCHCASTLYLADSRPAVQTPNEMIQRSFCSHFSPISCRCLRSQLSHSIWLRVAPRRRKSNPSTLCHCRRCCSDLGQAMMRSHLWRRSNFHWAKSERIVQ